MDKIETKVKDIAIFGAGGFGKEVACLIHLINQNKPTWNLIGFFDDGVEKGKQISHYGGVLGGMKELNDWSSPLDLAIAIGLPISLSGVKTRITNKNICFPNIIHPDITIVDPLSFSIGEGNIIQRGCSFSCDVVIGDFNVLNGDISFGHDDKIGDYNVLMPGLRISGEVEMGCKNFIGVGAIVLQQIKIGDCIKLGAGSVLMTKPKDGLTYIGVPAKKFDY